MQFSHAMLCLNCDQVSDAVLDTCPACGLRGLMSLKRAFEAIRHQHIFDSEYGVVAEDKATYLRCRCGERMQIH